MRAAPVGFGLTVGFVQKALLLGILPIASKRGSSGLSDGHD
jgi:hypothetical protein